MGRKSKLKKDPEHKKMVEFRHAERRMDGDLVRQERERQAAKGNPLSGKAEFRKLSEEELAERRRQDEAEARQQEKDKILSDMKRARESVSFT